MASAAIPYPWHQICAQEKSQKEDMFKRRKPRPKIASGNHDTTMESKGSHQMIRLMAPRTPKHHSWTHPQVFLPCLGCWGLQLLHPALNVSLPAVSPRESHRASPAQLLGQEESAGSSTCPGRILLQKSRALQEMWCPQEFLGWCWWRL